MPPPRPKIEKSPPVADEIRHTTCYMCACRCGIDVHIHNNEIRHIEGNRNHPVNRGVLCAKGAAGIMQHKSPARLQNPLLRTGERGAAQFKSISWDEALNITTQRLDKIRRSNPKKLAFFTGRDQSQALTGWWAQQFGTPNYAAHGGFCSVNMATAGIYTFGGSFWEFGEPDWERTKLFVLFGVAEDHASNPIKIGLSKLKARGARIIAVNPIRTGYNAIADDWIGITPGTDGLLILAIIRELLLAGRIDLDYLIRYTNASWLVHDNPGNPNHGLFVRDDNNQPLAVDRRNATLAPAATLNKNASLHGTITLPDHTSARPAFDLLIHHHLNPIYAPEAVAEKTGINATTIRNLARELASIAFDHSIELDQPWTDCYGEHHKTMIGRPVAFHAMRGISAHKNGFQTCRALHMLQILLGSIDCPGGFRFKPPYPKSAAMMPRPHGNAQAETPLAGPALGYPLSPEDLLLEADGSPQRIDKAFSWEAPLAAHGLMHMVITNAHAGDPYPIDTLFLYMANMAWNSTPNTAEITAMLTDRRGDDYVIPFIIHADAYASEMVAYADLILPDTTYLERHDCISLLDRPISDADQAADAIRYPITEPDRDVRPFQSVLLDLGARLGLPGCIDKDGKPRYRDYADYITNFEAKPGIGLLAGWRGENGSLKGRGQPHHDQLQNYIDAGCFWTGKIPEEARFFKHANRAYQDWAVEMGFINAPQAITFQLYLEELARFQRAAEGHGPIQPPPELAARIQACFTPLPQWYEANDQADGSPDEDYPFHAVTQRPAAMYHSWGSQNAWLRQIHDGNHLFVPAPVCDAHNLHNGDWVRITSPHGSISVPIMRMNAVNPHTLWTWNAIGKRAGAWALSPDAPEAVRGFIINNLIGILLPSADGHQRIANSDPITGQAAWYDLRVKLEKIDPGDGLIRPRPEPQQSPLAAPSPQRLTFGKDWCS